MSLRESITVVLLSAMMTMLCPLTVHGFVVVIDPGHGGKDPGALGVTAREKNINLGVALKLGKLLESEMKDVTTVYTRKKDVQVSLQGRADIANKANADLFVSIHTNSVDKKHPSRKTIAGASVYTLGLKRMEDNLEVAMRENAVMMLEDDYSTVYQGFDPNSTESYIMFEMSRDKNMDQSLKIAQAVQRQLTTSAKRTDRGIRQAVFWVLVKTTMPSILVELDFISNPQAEEYMASEKGQTQLARAIFNGIRAYKSSIGEIRMTEPKDNVKESSESDLEPMVLPALTPEQSIPERIEMAGKGVRIYKVQIMTSSKSIPDNSPKFKGLKDVSYYMDGKVYKYTWGASTSRDEMFASLKDIRKLFPDAFVICTIDGKRTE